MENGSCGIDAVNEELARTGHVTLRSLIDPAAVDAALRVINLGFAQHGVTTQQIADWSTTTWFPHLRWEPALLSLQAILDERLPGRSGEQWADTQIVVRLPDQAQTWPLTPHVDGVPEWAVDRRYRFIAGVALTRWSEQHGSVAVWPGSHRGEANAPLVLTLDPGDVVLLHHELQHSSTLNRSGAIRYAVYLRRLEPALRRASSGVTTRR